MFSGGTLASLAFGPWRRYNDPDHTGMPQCFQQGVIAGMLSHEIPLFEFDAEQRAVIEPTHERLPLQLPNRHLCKPDADANGIPFCQRHQALSHLCHSIPI